MATYVMSDLHGEYGKFLAMLEQIGFGEADRLYVLGDVLDRGEAPIPLLQDLSLRKNAVCLLGNHEWMALPLLEASARGRWDASLSEALTAYQEEGGDVTWEQFQALGGEEKQRLTVFLRGFRLYEELRVGEKRFLLSHTGSIDPEKPLREHSARELVEKRCDYDRDFSDPALRLLCGHTPTPLLWGRAEIFREKQYINLDCGAVFRSGRLACLRLEDSAEFYV